MDKFDQLLWFGGEATDIQELIIKLYCDWEQDL
jgi:hypothetical protein